MGEAAAILSLRHASKTYTGRSALLDVSLSIAQGEMVALIGPSGAGKSTLLRVINGLSLLDPGGRVEAFGACVQENSRIAGGARRLRARIGFVFQQFNLVGRLDLATNVRLGALGRTGFVRGLPGLWPAATRTAAAAAMERLGIAAQAKQRARTLSGGQQQRGAIARALTQGAEVILADEPVASLDPAATERVMAALRDLNRRDGITVVVSLHQVELARRWCDRIVALKDGRVAFDGRAERLDAAGVLAIYGQPAAASDLPAADPTPAEGAHG